MAENNSPNPKCSTFFFNSYEKKNNLLIEVQTEQPFAKNRKEMNVSWETVANNLKENFNYDCNSRQCREHFEALIKSFKKDDAKEKKGSGTDEDFGQYKQLCQDIVELMEACKEVPAVAVEVCIVLLFCFHKICC